MRGAVAVIFLSCVSLTLLGKYIMSKVASFLPQLEVVFGGIYLHSKISTAYVYDEKV